MIPIAAEHPFFHDPTFSTLRPQADFRGKSVNVNGTRVSTNPLPDPTISNQVGPNVATPGKTSVAPPAGATPSTVNVGTDTLFELENKLALHDASYVPSKLNATNPSQEDPLRSTPRELEEFRATPARLTFGYSEESLKKAATEGTLPYTIAGQIPQSYILPKYPASGNEPSPRIIDILV